VCRSRIIKIDKRLIMNHHVKDGKIMPYMKNIKAHNGCI